MTDQVEPEVQPRRLGKRILAIDPISRGFGFAVLESPDRLVDWGVVHVMVDKHRGCLRRIGDLIDHYRPALVVTEDMTAKETRRCQRIQRLIQSARSLARQRRVKYRAITWSRVRRVVSQRCTATKYQIAITLSQQFPELRPTLPKPRKPWMSEDDRMAIFDATSLGLTVVTALFSNASTLKTRSSHLDHHVL